MLGPQTAHYDHPFADHRLGADPGKICVAAVALASMHDIELASLAHLNMVAAFASLPPHQPRGFVQRINGVVIAATGSQIAFFNEVLPVDSNVDPGALIEAVRIVRHSGLKWVTQLREGIDDSLLAVVGKLGLQNDAADFLTAMALIDIPRNLALPDGFDVQRVIDDAGFQDHLDTAAFAAGADSGLFTSWLGPGIVDDPAVALFVGYENGTPVSTSLSVRTGEIVGIYNVNTLEVARRRGYGWATTAAAAVSAARAGCTIAVLQSSEMAKPIYEAHGFRTLFRYRIFREPTP